MRKLSNWYHFACKETEAQEAKFLASVDVSWQQVYSGDLDLLLPSPGLLLRTNIWPTQFRILDATLQLLQKRQDAEREGKGGSVPQMFQILLFKK